MPAQSTRINEALNKETQPHIGSSQFGHMCMHLPQLSTLTQSAYRMAGPQYVRISDLVSLPVDRTTSGAVARHEASLPSCYGEETTYKNNSHAWLLIASKLHVVAAIGELRVLGHLRYRMVAGPLTTQITASTYDTVCEIQRVSSSHVEAYMVHHVKLKIRDLLIRQCCHDVGYESWAAMELAWEAAYDRQIDRDLRSQLSLSFVTIMRTAETMGAVMNTRRKGRTRRSCATQVRTKEHEHVERGCPNIKLTQAITDMPPHGDESFRQADEVMEFPRNVEEEFLVMQEQSREHEHKLHA